MGSTTKLRYTTGSTLPCTGLCTRQARISWSRGLFRLYDSFYEIPRPCQHTPARNLPLRGTSGEQAAVVHLSFLTDTYGLRILCPYEVHAAIPKRWCKCKLKYTTSIALAYIAQIPGRRFARISWSTCSIGPHDSFRDSPNPCPRAPVNCLQIRGTCGQREAVVYLWLEYHRWFKH